jgi:anthranilate phosphoribosyltransferase
MTPEPVTSDLVTPDPETGGTAFEAMLAGDWPRERIAAYLTDLHERGETPTEIEGCARAMLSRCVRLPVDNVVDVGGTGGDGGGTFNISTTAAILVAATGVPVIKHGNRAVSGTCGSVDMLLALGVHVPARADAEDTVRRLARTGFAVAPTPVFHRFPEQLTAARRGLGFPTVFNLAGPLAHPAAGLTGQVVGVTWPRFAGVLAATLHRLGRLRAAVLHGQCSTGQGHGTGIDEPSLSGPTTITWLHAGQVETFDITPEQFGLGRAAPAELAGGDPAVNAGICRSVLSGDGGPRRDVVLLAAGIALWTAGLAASIADGMTTAARTIASGTAARFLTRLTSSDLS